mmetsp:Transcript_10956/g.16707  ORF Transcript_10956/g.16707 Transcript_10956/m.16707 type:complete len:541 (+) Transcript_10956:16-1638(+)
MDPVAGNLSVEGLDSGELGPIEADMCASGGIRVDTEHNAVDVEADGCVASDGDNAEGVRVGDEDHRDCSHDNEDDEDSDDDEDDEVDNDYSVDEDTEEEDEEERELEGHQPEEPFRTPSVHTNARRLECKSADDLIERGKLGPKFSTSVRRNSVNTLEFSNIQEDRSRWHDPYKNSVQSRLHAPTAAATHGKWVKPTDEEEKPEKASCQHRRFSTSMLPGELSTIHKELPAFSKRENSPYEHVQSRFHRMTLATENSKWVGSEKTMTDNGRAGSPRFRTTFKKSDAENILHVEACALASPPKDTLYRDIPSRLHETTVASEKAKFTPRTSVSSDASTSPPNLPKYNTNVRRGSVLDSDLPPPPIPEKHYNKYKNIGSRLHSPTASYLESAWKKEKSSVSSPQSNVSLRSSLSPKRGIRNDSRLCRPTVSSSHNVWPRSPNAPSPSLPDTGKPKIIRSKVYSNIESRLFNPTTAYVAKTIVVEDEAPVKEAFGHPIEPEYVDLVRQGKRNSQPSTPNATPTKVKKGHFEDPYNVDQSSISF